MVDINKLITSTGIGSQTGGTGLSVEQADRFLDYMYDSAVLLKSGITNKRMNSNSTVVQSVAVGKRLLRKATEGTDDGVNIQPAFAKTSVTAVKFRADYELTTESLEDNIEGGDFEDHIVRLITAQLAEDWEDVLINGDMDTTVDASLLSAMDGWVKIAKENGTVIDASLITSLGTKETEAGYTAGALTPSLVKTMLKAVPRKSRGKAGLRLFSNGEFLQDMSYVRNLHGQVDRGDMSNDERVSDNAGWTINTGFGVNATEVPLMPLDNNGRGDILLTEPGNLVSAIRRNVVVYREFNKKKDSWEYTTHMRGTAAVIEPSVTVVATNVQSL